MIRLLLAVAALALPNAALADPCEGPLPNRGARFTGEVRYVGDGDSLCVGATADPAEWVEVRLADFYAPELNEPGGQAAKAVLEAVALGKPANCVAQHRSWDRIVAVCRIGGVSIATRLRHAGVQEGGRGR